MAANAYHILAYPPIRDVARMPKKLDALARALARSGRLYINADTQRNFVHYTTANTTYSFTARELTEPDLLPATKALIARSIPAGLGPVAVNERIDILLAELKKARGVDDARELAVARLVVQAAHPAVIALLLQERTQLFVSFSHNVSDLMAVHFWQTHGQASGLQATEDTGAAVYISCGGDPLFDGAEDEKYYLSDGAEALARLLVIGGQELGHYADLIRTPHGIAGRHSAQMAPLRPTAICKAGRDSDMRRVQALWQALEQAGLRRLKQAEDAVAFYEKQHQRFAPLWCLAQLRRWLAWVPFSRSQPVRAVPYHATLPRLRCATFYHEMLADMAFNLAPDAAAYKRADPQEEEAIACIEALARVPQQANKWGHDATNACWPELYRLYYGQVIPAVRAALPASTNKQLSDIYELSSGQKLRRLWRRRA